MISDSTIGKLVVVENYVTSSGNAQNLKIICKQGKQLRVFAVCFDVLVNGV